MGAIDWLCLALGINKGAFLSGLLGGVFSLRWVGEVGWTARGTTVLFGGLAANWGATPVYTWFAVKGLHEAAVGFLIGLFAMSLTAAIFKAVMELNLTTMLREKVRILMGLPPAAGGGA